MSCLRIVGMSTIVAFVSACGGNTFVLTPVATASATRAAVTFRFSAPVESVANAKRSPRYISLNSHAFVILTDGSNPQTINVSRSSPNCRTINGGGSLSCTIGFRTTAGTHNFSITSYAQTDGRGAALSTNLTGPIVVGSGSDTVVAITLDGIVHSARLALQSVDPHAGTSAKIPVTVVLEDASGAITNGAPPADNAS